MTEDEMVGWHQNSMGMRLSKLRQLVMDRETWRAEVHVVAKVQTGLNSFRIDWLDLLAVQWTLKSLLQHHSSKASILRCSAFFTVQLSSIKTTGKTIALTRRTLVGKVMSPLLNMLSRLVITNPSKE